MPEKWLRLQQHYPLRTDLSTSTPWSRLRPLQLDPQLSDPQSEDRKKGGHAPIYINGAEVERVETVKFLAVTMADNLFWISHVAVMVKKTQEGTTLPLLPQDRHLCASIYRKTTDNLTMLHFSSFHTQHVKEVIPYGQALHRHSVCSDEEERDGHLKVLQDAPSMVYWRNHADAMTTDELTPRNNHQTGMFPLCLGTLQQSRTFSFRSS
eukprot:g45051.t1